MKRLLIPALIATTVLAVPARAAVNVERRSDENPMVEIARSTMYGALAGTLVGSAFALATEADDGDAVRWGFVFGTFIGAGYGFYAVTSRPQPSALLEWREGRLSGAGIAALEASPRAVRVRLLGARF